MGIEPAKNGIKGSTFPTACWAGDQEDTVGDIHDDIETGPGTPIETQGIQVETDALFIQQAHDQSA